MPLSTPIGGHTSVNNVIRDIYGDLLDKLVLCHEVRQSLVCRDFHKVSGSSPKSSLGFPSSIRVMPLFLKSGCTLGLLDLIY